MNDIKRQELASRLVDREIYYCVSSLFYEMGQLPCFYESEYYEDWMNLQARDDWETPATYFIEQDADISELEDIAELSGLNLPQPYETMLFEDTPMWSFDGAAKLYDDEDDAQEAIYEQHSERIRQAVLELVSENDAWQEVCDNHRLDTEQTEAYEHWLISGWLASKLAERGYITGDFMGMTVWGRTTTGQSISMDYVIQEIAVELFGE